MRFLTSEELGKLHEALTHWTLVTKGAMTGKLGYVSDREVQAQRTLCRLAVEVGVVTDNGDGSEVRPKM